MNEFRFYVYAYLRADNSPYYIGKGSNNRAWQSMKGHRPPKDKQRVVILETKLSDIGTLALERRMILWYGRKDLGTGILHNHTDGGDGANPGPETRKKISEKGKLRVQTPETRLKQSLAAQKRWESKELRDRQSSAVSDFWNGKPRPKSAESIAKAAKTNTGKRRGPNSIKGNLNISAGRKLTGPLPKKQCIYCSKWLDPGNLNHWHNDRCKQKPK